MEVASIFLNRVLSEAAKKGASNLHLSVGSFPMVKINGELKQIQNENILTLDTLNQIIDSLIDNKDENLKKQKELTIVKDFADNLRFKINIFYQKGLPVLSFSYINNSIIKDSKKIPDILENSIDLSSGLLIVGGSNYSGKTTTIASVIEKINQKNKKYIITIENPIEYLFVNKESIIEQREVKKDTKSYLNAIKHCLDEDVDLVYIDSIKDDFGLAIPYILELAGSNTLVILEMNTKDSINTLEKILNFSGDSLKESISYSLADVLLGIVIQKLIPGRGEMLVANEVLVSNPAIKSLIKERKISSIKNIIQTSKGEGMIIMERSIKELVEKKKITKDEAKNLGYKF